jgi:hypothetical protein
MSVGIAVGTGVGFSGGETKLKNVEALDGLNCPETPAKVAVMVITPPPVGVTWQLALPLESVAPEHPELPSVKLICLPESATTGLCEMSVRLATTVTG